MLIILDQFEKSNEDVLTPMELRKIIQSGIWFDNIKVNGDIATFTYTNAEYTIVSHKIPSMLQCFKKRHRFKNAIKDDTRWLKFWKWLEIVKFLEREQLHVYLPFLIDDLEKSAETLMSTSKL